MAIASPGPNRNPNPGEWWRYCFVLGSLVVVFLRPVLREQRARSLSFWACCSKQNHKKETNRFLGPTILTHTQVLPRWFNQGGSTRCIWQNRVPSLFYLHFCTQRNPATHWRKQTCLRWVALPQSLNHRSYSKSTFQARNAMYPDVTSFGSWSRGILRLTLAVSSRSKWRCRLGCPLVAYLCWCFGNDSPKRRVLSGNGESFTGGVAVLSANLSGRH